MRRVVRVPELMVLLALLVVILGFVILAPKTFLSPRNIGAILTASAQLGVAAIGAAVLIISGEFDISVGSNYAFTGIAIGLLSTSGGLPTWLAVICGLLISTAIGLANGAITLGTRIPSFITTLGTWLVSGIFDQTQASVWNPGDPADDGNIILQSQTLDQTNWGPAYAPSTPAIYGTQYEGQTFRPGRSGSSLIFTL